MSEKNYNFENFESNETQSYGKHYKADPDMSFLDENDTFDVDQNVTTPKTPIDNEDTTPDYGDDFDQNEEDDGFVPYVENAYPKYDDDKKEKAPRDKELKKKNTAIIVLSVILALVVLGFSLFFIISSTSKDDGDTKATKPTLSTSQNATKPTQIPTQAATQAPTEPETQAPTDPPTEPETEAPTDSGEAGGSIEDPSVEYWDWE